MAEKWALNTIVVADFIGKSGSSFNKDISTADVCRFSIGETHRMAKRDRSVCDGARNGVNS